MKEIERILRKIRRFFLNPITVCVLLLTVATVSLITGFFDLASYPILWIWIGAGLFLATILFWVFFCIPASRQIKSGVVSTLDEKQKMDYSKGIKAKLTVDYKSAPVESKKEEFVAPPQKPVDVTVESKQTPSEAKTIDTAEPQVQTQKSNAGSSKEEIEEHPLKIRSKEAALEWKRKYEEHLKERKARLLKRMKKVFKNEKRKPRRKDLKQAIVKNPKPVKRIIITWKHVSIAALFILLFNVFYFFGPTISDSTKTVVKKETKKVDSTKSGEPVVRTDKKPKKDPVVSNSDTQARLDSIARQLKIVLDQNEQALSQLDSMKRLVADLKKDSVSQVQKTIAETKKPKRSNRNSSAPHSGYRGLGDVAVRSRAPHHGYAGIGD